MKSKIKKFFSASICLLLIAVTATIFVVKKVSADTRPVPSSAGGSSGDFAEEWVATEITGDTMWYNFEGGYNARTHSRIKVSSSSLTEYSPTDRRYIDAWFIGGALQDFIAKNQASLQVSNVTEDGINIPRLYWTGNIPVSAGGLLVNYDDDGERSYNEVTRWHVTGHAHQ